MDALNRNGLLPTEEGDEPEDAAQQQTQNQTRDDREVELRMIFFDVDVARQFAQEGNFVEDHQHTPHSNHHNTEYYKYLAQIHHGTVGFEFWIWSFELAAGNPKLKTRNHSTSFSPVLS